MSNASLLNGALAALQPYLEEAAKTAPAGAWVQLVTVEAGDPAMVVVLYLADDGTTRAFECVCSGESGQAIAETYTPLIEWALNQVDVANRVRLAKLLALGSTIEVEVDPLRRSATTIICIPGLAPKRLVTLRQKATTH